jgi:hypothetical protein
MCLPSRMLFMTVYGSQGGKLVGSIFQTARSVNLHPSHAGTTQIHPFRPARQRQHQTREVVLPCLAANGR